jgi:hypothetical protein
MLTEFLLQSLSSAPELENKQCVSIEVSNVHSLTTVK